MKATHKITLEIPDEIFTEIDGFKKRMNIADDQSAVVRLIKYALMLPTYFKDFDWEKAEQEADTDIDSGRVKGFSSVDEFLADLKA
jgi:hypothetical protein